MSDYFDLQLDAKAVGAVSSLGLAHVGDAVFELMVRSHLCATGRASTQNMHRLTVRYVSAPAQSAAVARILPLLDEEEQGYYRRGRNAHVHTIPKHATQGEYSRATGLEALFGALYLLGRKQRLSALFDAVMEEEHAV
ncbi:MAG: ribonuclease III domain-containing protein [Oscillospiraceae bacterium]|nr:ribonuclease III domain-containing protein [Oscillospiraceae bacterium]